MGVALVCAAAVSAGACAVASADPPLPEAGGVAPLGSEVSHLHFKYGPIHIAPGQNLILAGPVTLEKPAYDGYVTSFRPDLVRADGSVPPIEQIHLHHAVWLNGSREDATASNLGERFAAAGEEKTITRAPPGYGYPVKGTDVWLLNYMIHNQTPVPDTVWVTYDVDYVPADVAAGRIKPVRPVWMDVQNGSAYPVFDVHRGTGAEGRFTYPDDDPSAPRKNEWTVDRDGTLVGTAGHVHPGGLWTDLDVLRDGATRRLFQSDAKYFDPNGPVSWDLSMTATDPDWRVAVRRGDRLRVSATYETERASWYESMGIMVAWMAPPEADAKDPFVEPIDTSGEVTHGHLPEADNHGGSPQGLPDPRTLPDGQTLSNSVGIAGFTYLPGNFGLAGFLQNPPVVARGQSLRFGNFDASGQVFHTVTACRAPCTGATGISYPLADGAVDFDSGELGYGPTGFTAAKNEPDWYTPVSVEPGTYTYFCRIHPYMRGAFRVK
jgi:plastocyanin